MVKLRNYLILSLLTAFCYGSFWSCNSEISSPSVQDTLDSVAPEQEDFDESEWDNWLKAYNNNEQQNAATQQQEPDPVPAQTSAPAKSQQVTKPSSNDLSPKPHSGSKSIPNGTKIYVSTYGAQGQVWGYVVMNGNSGSGTIHDPDENTLSIRVSRHGNELYAIDQNSRQYVFKLD